MKKLMLFGAVVAAVVGLTSVSQAGVVLTSAGQKVENPLACGYVLPDKAATNFTFEAWLKMPAKALSDHAYAMGVAKGGQDGWASIYLKEGLMKPSFRTATTGSKTNVYLTVSEDVAPNTWIHIAGVRDFDNNKVLLYTNGVLDVEYTLVTKEKFASTCEAFFGVGGLGLGWDNSRATWKGALSDVRVWTTARSAAEIAANYDKRLLGTEEGLAVYFPLASVTNNATVEYVSGKPVRVNAPNFALVEDATAPIAAAPASAVQKAFKLAYAASTGAIGYGTDVRAGKFESLTFEGWVKPDADAAPIICQGSNNSAGRLRVQMTSSRELNIVNTTWGKASYTSEANFFPEGEWVHFAVVRDYENGQLRIYKNGVRVAAFDSTTGSNSTDQITIATANRSNGARLGGSFLEVRAWTEARTDAQIADMYQKMAYGNEANLILCIHFNEGESYYARNVCGTAAVARSWGSGSVAWVDDPDLPALTYAAETAPAAYFTGNGVTAGRTYQRYTTLEDFTFEAWVYPKYLSDASAAYDALCCRAGGSTAEGSFSLGFQYRGSPYMYLKAAKNSGQNDQILAKDIENAGLDRWDHFAWVREKTGDTYTARVYHNGTLLMTTNNFSAAAIYNTDFVIGGRSVTTTSSGFTGGIKDVRVWNKARTTEEIAADYRRQLNGREKGLIGYWPLTETEGTNLTSKVRGVANGGLFAPYVDIPKLTLGEAVKFGAVIVIR